MKLLPVLLATASLFCTATLVKAVPFSSTVISDRNRPAVIIDRNLVVDGGFENHFGEIEPPWIVQGEGSLPRTTINGSSYGEAYAGDIRASISASSRRWIALTQVLQVEPGVEYHATAKIRNVIHVEAGYFGVRTIPDNKLITEAKFAGPNQRAWREVSFIFKTAPNQKRVSLFVGLWSSKEDSESTIEVDEVSVKQYVADPIGELFHVRMWADMTGTTDSDDSPGGNQIGPGDNRVECYGTLRFNGETWWDVDRAAGHPRSLGKDQILQISEDAMRKQEFTFQSLYDGSTPFHLDLKLHDRDDTSADDDLGVYDETLDLAAVAKKPAAEQTFTWDGKQGLSTRLHVKVEHYAYVASSGSPFVADSRRRLRMRPSP